MSWRGGIKRDKTDILFSYLVRERADWNCEYCNVNYRHNPSSLHCSHVYTRANKAIRTHPLNAFAHCIKCHERLERNPLLFAEWVRVKLGEANYNKLKFLSGKATKFSKFDKELIHKHFLKEKKRLHQLRSEGVRGRLVFTLP